MQGGCTRNSRFRDPLFLLIFLITFLLSSKCDEQKDCYQLLQVERGASQGDVKKAFRILAVKYHPDKNADPQARIKFEEIANGMCIWVAICLKLNLV